MTLTPGCPEDHSNVPSGGTRQALDMGRETTRNHEKWGTWQWAQSLWAWWAGSEGSQSQDRAPSRGPGSTQNHCPRGLKGPHLWGFFFQVGL